MSKMSSLSVAIACLTSLSLLSRYYPLPFSLLLTFLVLYGIVFLAWVTYMVVLYPHFLSPTRHLPSPPGGDFLTGHFFDIFHQPVGVPLIKFTRSVANRGMIRYRSFLNQERILPTSPEILKEVLHTQPYTFVKPPYMRLGIGSVLGLKGLLFVEGKEHQHQRKLLTPAFSYGQIKALVPMFWERSMQLQRKIDQVIAVTGNSGVGGEAVVEMAGWLSLVTLDIIGDAGFGYECNALASAPIAGEKAKSGSELAEAYNILFAQGADMAMVLVLLSIVFPRALVTNLPIHRNRQVKKATAIIDRVTAEIIEEKKTEVAKTSGAGGGKDILTAMLRSGHYSAEADSSIKDQLMTFLAAGHETTATALTWAIYLLSLPEHRHIQERLRAEIYSRFPGSLPETVTYDGIESLKYLRNVTMEVLRLHAPVRVTLREAAHDTTLGGEFVPKGTYIVISPFAINRSLELWGEDADEFNPDRWEKPVANSYSFLTFLSGPRSCIGASFAKAEFKCLLMAMIGSFEFEEAEEFKGRELVIKGGVTQKPVGGIPVCVRKVRWDRK